MENEIRISSSEIMERLGIPEGESVIEAIDLFYGALKSSITGNYHPPNEDDLKRLGITKEEYDQTLNYLIAKQ